MHLFKASRAYAIMLALAAIISSLLVTIPSSKHAHAVNADFDVINSWGSNGITGSQFSTPTDVRIDSTGNVLIVADDRVLKFSGDGFSFLTGWGGSSNIDGKFQGARGLALDSNGNIYVTDPGNHRIQVFDSNGIFLRKWGMDSINYTNPFTPLYIAIDSSNHLFVTDDNNAKVWKFDNNGNILGSWGGANGNFSGPLGIAIDSTGNVFVVDSHNDRVQKFDNNGTFLTSWGSFGSANGQFTSSVGIAIDKQGNVFVSDNLLANIQEFTNNGGFVAKFQYPFFAPMGMFFDSAENLYVCDESSHRIHIFGHPAYPLTHMRDTTASGGRSLYSEISFRGEGVTFDSQLIGDSIDQITLRLAKVGAPTGIASIWVIDREGDVTEEFGSIDVSTLGTTYKDYTFTLGNSSLYTIKVGDVIGIVFEGGNSTNYVNVMVDTNAADPFDQDQSYRLWYTTTWHGAPAEDMYMILRQTHAPGPFMIDTTASAGRALYSAIPIRAEYVSETSQLLGASINQITLRLAKVGAPTGDAIIGIFDELGNVNKAFGTQDVSALGTAYKDYTYTLPIQSGELYELRNQERIGILYNGGSTSNYVSVMVDTNPSDPFDGTASFRQWFTTSWQSLTGEDMYMILARAHLGSAVITHMEDTSASGGRALYSGMSIRGEYVTPTSQLIGDKIDQITMRLARAGTPTGVATIGIFDSAGNLKKQFGLQNVASIGTTYSDYTFTLSINDAYVIQSGDRIGIKYAGGNATSYVNVMVDTSLADPFDGTKSHRQWFTTSWQSLTGEDMYMILKQTH